MERELILGPPGTGKTTRLISIVEQELARGVSPEKIAFASFTKKAAEEAADRAASSFALSKRDLPYFRTLHSIAFKELGVRRDEVMSTKHYHELGELLGLTFSTRFDVEEGVPSSRFTGDRYVFLEGFSRARRVTPELAWQELGNVELDWFEFKRFVDTLREFKRHRGMIDFSDMLEMLDAPLDLEVAIIDEGQDLSTLQWDFAMRAFANVKRMYVAGDDDQGIFQWSGADIERFLGQPGKRTVLDRSWRIPRAVHRVAEGISGQISRRFNKVFMAKAEEGCVEWHRQPDDVDLSSGSWLLLARNIHLLKELVKVARNAGVPYKFRGEPAIGAQHQKAIRWYEDHRKGRKLSDDEVKLVEEMLPRDKRGGQAAWPGVIWHEALTRIPLEDREYYISILRRGGSLTKEPIVNVSTIHGVKGGEADHVLMLTDMSAKTFEGYQADHDTEHRVFYVGATRCMQSLHIVEPQTKYSYTI